MTIDYADGAESAVLAALRAAEDVGAGSTELARPGRHVGDRVPLLAGTARAARAAADLSPGLRVVDLGCGSGVLTRALGEAGASVLGIEGAPDRAAAARERCRDLAGRADHDRSDRRRASPAPGRGTSR